MQRPIRRADGLGDPGCDELRDTAGSASDSKQLAIGPPPCVWLAPIKTFAPGMRVSRRTISRARAVVSAVMKSASMPTSAMVLARS